MGRPRLIILVRHGESEGNCDKSVNRHTPNHKIPLTERGHKQALNAGERLNSLLNPDDKVLFYTSPYLRTRQTTNGMLSVLKENNVSYRVHEEPRMREQDFGNFQAEPQEMERIWAERAHYGHFFYRIPNGESAADVFDRCSGFNETLFRQFNSDKFPSVLVLVAHGIWVRVFLMKWFRWSVEQFESLRNVRHCEFLVMQKKKDSHKFDLITKMKTWDDVNVDELCVGCPSNFREIAYSENGKTYTNDSISNIKDKKLANIKRLKTLENLQEMAENGVQVVPRPKRSMNSKPTGMATFQFVDEEADELQKEKDEKIKAMYKNIVNRKDGY